MARKRPPPQTSGEVPAWFMTYSDVVTLMMTFFILLLTFATSEPERFEQMQSSLFGLNGRPGIAGENEEGVDREAIVLRMRPKIARLTTRGSETPPIYTDPIRESLERGLTALNEPNDLAREQRFQTEVNLPMFADSRGDLTTLAEQHLKMLALQMQRLPLSVHLEVTRDEDVPIAVQAAQFMTANWQIHPARMSVGVGEPSADGSRRLRFFISRRYVDGPLVDQTGE